MITNCVLLYAAFVSNFSIGVTPETDQLKEITYCQNNLPANTLIYAPLIVKYFDEINIETAVKVIWCESRNKKNAYNYKANDSGLFQSPGIFRRARLHTLEGSLEIRRAGFPLLRTRRRARAGLHGFLGQSFRVESDISQRIVGRRRQNGRRSGQTPKA